MAETWNSIEAAFEKAGLKPTHVQLVTTHKGADVAGRIAQKARAGWKAEIIYYDDATDRFKIRLTHGDKQQSEIIIP